MAKTRLPYTPEFRRQMVELVQVGRSPEELAREFEPTAQSIRNWVAHKASPAEGGCPCFGSSYAKSLWSPNVPESGEIRPTFQKAFSKMTFAGSNPSCPARQSNLYGVIPGCVRTADIPAG